VVDQGLPSRFGPEDKYRFRVDASRALGFLGLGRLIHPREPIEYIVRRRLGKERGQAFPSQSSSFFSSKSNEKALR